MTDIQKGYIHSVEGSRAYVKLYGQEEPIPKPMQLPKNAAAAENDMVLVANKVSGEYIILQIYGGEHG